MYKKIFFDKLAEKEFRKLSTPVQSRFNGLLFQLEEDGFLEIPRAKQLTNGLFEMRISYQGQWRGLYAHLYEEEVIVLSFFHKKTQQTPQNEIKKALQRLKYYSN